MTHTPEPFDQPMPVGETWTQCPNNGYDILIGNGDFVGAFVHDDTHSKFSRARCARAVACVNSLRGLDVAKVEVLLDAIREYAGRVESKASAGKLDAACYALDVAFNDLVKHIRAGGAQ